MTSSLADAWSPTTMRTGLLTMSPTRICTFFFIVAVKRRVCLSGRVWQTMERICCSKPRDNIRSASSSTRYVTRTKFVAFFRRNSMRRPGDAIRMSVPAFRDFHCSCLFSPPSRQSILILYFLV